MASQRVLIFIHGLWMSGAESRWLRRRLEARFGFETATFGYRTVSEPLPTVLDRLHADRSTAPGADRLHVIGHSLGRHHRLPLLRALPRRRRPAGSCSSARRCAAARPRAASNASASAAG